MLLYIGYFKNNIYKGIAASNILQALSLFNMKYFYTLGIVLSIDRHMQSIN